MFLIVNKENNCEWNFFKEAVLEIRHLKIAEDKNIIDQESNVYNFRSICSGSLKLIYVLVKFGIAWRKQQPQKIQV